MEQRGEVTVIVGEQRGDEGKGRFVDMLAEYHDIVARFNGGNNAGHTVVTPDGREFKLHTIPSGIIHPHVTNVIGNGVLLNGPAMEKEIAHIEDNGVEVTPQNLKISTAAHLILPCYISEDEMREAGGSAQGSTKMGIAQGYAVKSMRLGMQFGTAVNNPLYFFEQASQSLLANRKTREELGLKQIDCISTAREYTESIMRLGKFAAHTQVFLNQELAKNKRILAEGAQAFQLDIDHGMYPFTTSSTATSGGAATGLGIPPTAIRSVVGVSKAIQSHVGDGPFVTEIYDEVLLKQLHGDVNKIDSERGTTTDRMRRLGYLDLVGIRRSQMINGTGTAALSKLDWVPRYGDTVQVCTAYELDGRVTKNAPATAAELSKCIPIYTSLPTWKESIQNVRFFRNLPKAARDYIAFIEKQTGTPITHIGVGPQRDQVIKH